MKLAGFTLVLATVFTLGGCGADNAQKAGEPNPSLKADFESKTGFVLASLTTSIEARDSSSMGSTEIEFLVSRLRELQNLVPVSGFAVPATWDNLYQTERKFPKDQTAIRLDGFKAWTVCTQHTWLSEVTVSVGNWRAVAKPTPSHAYLFNDRGTLDYDTTTPQVDLKPETITIINLPAEVLLPSQSRDCNVTPRQVVSFRQMSSLTLNALTKWKTTVGEVIAEVETLRQSTPSNYPTAYVLKNAKNRLQTAYDQLP